MKTSSVVIVSHFAPFPPRAGNEYRLSRLILWLREKGFHVSLVVRPRDALTSEQRKVCQEHVENLFIFPLHGTRHGWLYNLLAWPTALAERAVKYIKIKHLSSEEQRQLRVTQSMEDRFAPPNFVSYVRDIIRRQQPTIVIAEYVFTSRVLLGLPKRILKIIDTHDLFSTKIEKVIALGVEDPLYLSQPAETALLHRADLILAIQEKEREAINNMVPDRAVINLGVDFPIKLSTRKATGNKLLPGTCTLLIVASDNALNRRGLQELLDHAWPGIVSAAPNVWLRIVGKVTEGMQFSQPNLKVVGTVDDLGSEYAQADIVLNPVRAGTGLKVKSVEAVCHGKPLLTFPNGVDGFPHDDSLPFIVVDSWQNFTRVVIALSKDQVQREELAKYAESYAIRHFSKAHVFSELEAFLRSHFP